MATLPRRQSSTNCGTSAYRGQHRHTHIHASSGIRIRDPSVQATEDGKRLKPRTHCCLSTASYISFLSHGVRLSPLGTSAIVWPTVPAPDDRWWWMWSNRWNENWQRKPKYLEKTCPSVTLSTTDSTWSDPGSSTGRRGENLATNRLSYGTAYQLRYRKGKRTPLSVYWHRRRTCFQYELCFMVQYLN
jgi:hypothetical protein